MKDVVGKTAFITGGVSGVGLGIAKVFARAGMKTVITYRREDHLEQAMAWFRQHPTLTVHPIKVDVTDREGLQRAADETERVFGKVHVLCNNAGVNIFGPMEEATFEDWEWVMGVNFWGVVNGIKTFLPRIRKHGEEGHIINVASMASFITGPQAGLYTASKYAVRGLTECLRDSLASTNIGVSLMSPGLTKSNIHESPMGRPANLASKSGYSVTPELMKFIGDVHSRGMEPEEVGEKTLRGMLRNDLYIFSHPEGRDEVRENCEEILAAFPDEPVPEERMEVERMRRQAKADAKSARTDVTDMTLSPKR
jgi:NAD(P)-dependent dehydrogenase (short-subunit alcohol dehydrogenase family)